MAGLGSSIEPAAVLATVIIKKEECESKQWTIHAGNGRTVTIRNIFEKIAQWIWKYVAVGDVAVQYDPAHAALPWAIIRFILQVRFSSRYSFYQ